MPAGKPHDPKPTQQPQDPSKPGPGSPTAENLGAATPQTEDSTKKEQEQKEGEDSAEDSEALPQQFGGAVLGGLSLVQLLRLVIQVIDLVGQKAPQAQSAQGGGAATQQRDLDQLDRARQSAEHLLEQHQK